MIFFFLKQQSAIQLYLTLHTSHFTFQLSAKEKKQKVERTTKPLQYVITQLALNIKLKYIKTGWYRIVIYQKELVL